MPKVNGGSGTIPAREGEPAETRVPTALAAAASALVLGALAFTVGETAAAHAWSHPRYSYRDNFISDLGIVLGALGIVAALTWMATFGVTPPGVLERVAAYAFMLWQVVFGAFLLHASQPVLLLLHQSSASSADKTP
jgi:hypothetical membrane protein